MVELLIKNISELEEHYRDQAEYSAKKKANFSFPTFVNNSY